MKAFRRFRAFWRGLCWPGRIAFLAAAIAAVIYGGSKGGLIIIDDPYIVDDGSVLTNDIVRVSIDKRSPLVPDTIEILVYARRLDLTNATDWVRLTPHLTLADHPFDYALPNATNHEVRVAANYVEPPSPHTNGVWQVAGFLIPGGDGKIAVKGAKTDVITDNEQEQAQ